MAETVAEAEAEATGKVASSSSSSSTPPRATSPSPPPAASSSLHKQVHQASAQMAQLQLLLQEKENEVQSLGGLVKTLKARIDDELLGETARFRERNMELERQLSAGMLMKAEQDKIAQGLRKELRLLGEARADLAQNNERLELRTGELEAAAAVHAGMGEELAALQAQLSDKAALVTRLRSEALTNENPEEIKEALERLKNSSMEIGKAIYSQGGDEGSQEAQQEEPAQEAETSEEKKEEKKE